jgi:hypothetical protein
LHFIDFGEIMMNFKRFLSYIAIVLVGLLSACQTESTVEIYSTNETITKTSPLTTYLERVVLNNTSLDNIIDKTNCFTVKFPYVVTVNNVQISINSVSDYQYVQNNINANTNDNDIVTFHFPITVILSNYTEKTLSNQIALNSLIIECQSNSNDFGKINCVSINYPIAISTYDSNKQIASTITLTTNQSLYSFIENLEDNKYIAVNYPISIINSNGQNTTITTNNQLEDFIKSALDICPDNVNTALDIIQTLTNNTWKISYYYYSTDKTSNYSGYSFTFSSNNKVVATKSGVSYNGTWSSKIDNGIREFQIKIEAEPLHKLDEGWKLFEFSSNQIRLRHQEGVNENGYLYFDKI